MLLLVPPLVLVLHMAAWVALLHTLGAPGRHKSLTEPARISVRLLPLPVAPSARTEPQRPRADTPRAPAAIAPVRSTSTAPRDFLPIDSVAATAESVLAAGLPALPASQPPHPLNLELPRGYAAQARASNPATADARANTARLSPETRMARTFDTQVTEEVMDGGRRRVRQGDKCVIATPSRTTQLMPFSESAARIPAMVSACP